MQNQADTVKGIFKHVKLPTEGQGLTVLKGKDSMPREYRDFNGQNYVASLGTSQFGFLGTLMSEQTGRNYGISILQENYNLVHSKTSEGKAFWQLNKDYYFHNAEVFRKTADGVIIFPRPKVVEKQGELVYDGKSKKVKINKDDDVVETLENAGLFKEGEHKIYHGLMTFDDNGESSVRSLWFRGMGCFGANSHRPSDGYALGLAAFRLLGPKSEVKQPKKREIAEAEYQELLGKG